MSTSDAILEAGSPLPREKRIVARLVGWLPAIACFGIAFVFTFARAISERVYSDEHLFLGGAGLMARREGLIYRDFFYNHMPTHALVLASLFKCTVHWVLAARTFDAFCAAALVAVLFETARRSFVGTSPPWRIALATSVGAIFLFNPVTADAVGKAWNHDLAALSCVLGFVVLATGLGRDRPALWVFTSGMCAAIAITSRLTFVPPLLAFPLLILIAPGRTFSGRLKLIGLFSLGGMIGAAPALFVFAQAPANAYFENVKFPGLTTRYQGELQRGARDTLLRKLDFVQRVGAKSWSLQVIFWLTVAVTLGALVIEALRRWAVPTLRGTDARFVGVVALTLAACFAAFVPTPMFHQYLYGPIPFAALAIAWGFASLQLERFIIARLALIALAFVCYMSGRDGYRGVALSVSPSKWSTTDFHKDGKRLARLAAPGRVLTFLPGLPLEAGLPIYDGLSIGRYATRIAPYLTPGQRSRMNVPDIETMREWFKNDPPGAVLLAEPKSPLEAPIAALAEEYGYTAQPFNGEWVLYLPSR